MYQPELIYTTEEHGSSVTTFFNRVEQYEPTLMIIKTTRNEVNEQQGIFVSCFTEGCRNETLRILINYGFQVFGAYCSTAWAVRNEKDQRGERQRYFGTGETFL